MPYRKQDIEVYENCFRLDMKYLNSKGYLKQNKDFETVVNWYRGDKLEGNLNLLIYNTAKPKYICLKYQITNTETNEKEKLLFRINLIEHKSNLGRGVYYYFECPETLRACRILYKAYNSKTFKSRFAYRQRIYYKLQTLSKSFYPIERKNKIQRQIKRLSKSRIRETYKGKKTTKALRLLNLEKDYQYFEMQCYRNMYNTIQKHLKQIDGKRTK